MKSNIKAIKVILNQYNSDTKFNILFKDENGNVSVINTYGQGLLNGNLELYYETQIDGGIFFWSWFEELILGEIDENTLVKNFNEQVNLQREYLKKYYGEELTSWYNTNDLNEVYSQLFDYLNRAIDSICEYTNYNLKKSYQQERLNKYWNNKYISLIEINK